MSSLPGKASRTLVDIARLAEIKRILGECLLISSLPGKALRTLVESRGLSSNTRSVLETEPGKPDITLMLTFTLQNGRR